MCCEAWTDLIYLGEDGSPDGLNLGNLGGRQESLELVGLYSRNCIISPNLIL